MMLQAVICKDRNDAKIAATAAEAENKKWLVCVCNQCAVAFIILFVLLKNNYHTHATHTYVNNACTHTWMDFKFDMYDNTDRASYMYGCNVMWCDVHDAGTHLMVQYDLALYWRDHASYFMHHLQHLMLYCEVAINALDKAPGTPGKASFAVLVSRFIHVLHHISYIIHHTSCITYLTSHIVITHRTSYIIHHTSYYHTSYYHTSYIIRHISYIIHHTTIPHTTYHAITHTTYHAITHAMWQSILHTYHTTAYQAMLI